MPCSRESHFWCRRSLGEHRTLRPPAKLMRPLRTDRAYRTKPRDSLPTAPRFQDSDGRMFHDPARIGGEFAMPQPDCLAKEVLHFKLGTNLLRISPAYNAVPPRHRDCGRLCPAGCGTGPEGHDRHLPLSVAQPDRPPEPHGAGRTGHVRGPGVPVRRQVARPPRYPHGHGKRLRPLPDPLPGRASLVASLFVHPWLCPSAGRVLQGTIRYRRHARVPAYLFSNAGGGSGDRAVRLPIPS